MIAKTSESAETENPFAIMKAVPGAR